VKQTIIFKGAEVSIAPNDEQLMVEEVANKFLLDCQGLIEEVAEDFGAEYQDNESGKLWIANVTGNPDAPSMVQTRLFDSKLKRWVTADIENPIKAPRDLKEWAEGPMEEYTAKDGVAEALNHAGHYVRIPAFRRRQLDAGEVEWFMNRVSNAARAANIPGYPVSVAMISRAPSNFEPDTSWELNDIRMYLRLADPDAIIGPSEEEVLEQAAKDGVEEYEWAQRMNDAKRLEMKRVYFRLINPKYTLPTRATFNELKSRSKKRQKAVTEQHSAGASA
jgi:hypothetical protein